MFLKILEIQSFFSSSSHPNQQTSQGNLKNLKKETNPPILPVITIICLTGPWISFVCFSFILPTADTKADWKGIWCAQETRSIELLGSRIWTPSSHVYFEGGELVLRFAIEAIVVLLHVKTELKGETVFPSDGLFWPGKPMNPLVARGRVSASLRAVWII